MKLNKQECKGSEAKRRGPRPSGGPRRSIPPKLDFQDQGGLAHISAHTLEGNELMHDPCVNALKAPALGQDGALVMLAY